MNLTIYQSAYTARELESAIAGGRAPSAAGLTEFPLTAYTVSGPDMAALSSAIAEKSGTPAPAFPNGWQEAVEGIRVAVPVYYTPGGKCYLEHMTVAPMEGGSEVNALNTLFANCVHLKTVVTGGGVYTASNNSMFDGCVSLTHAACENIAAYGHYVFRNCHALQAARLGSLGVPVTAMAIHTFNGCAQADLEITLYVDAQTLAQIPAAVTDTAPWGAANATVIYRNSTTGEVITE